MEEDNEGSDFFGLIVSFAIVFYVYYYYQPLLIPFYTPVFFHPREYKYPITKGHFKSVFVSCFFPITDGPIRNQPYVYKNRANLLFDYFSQQEQLYVYTPEKGKDYLLLKDIKDYTSILDNNTSTLYRSVTPNIHFITTYQNVFEISQIAKYKPQYEKIANDMRLSQYSPISAEIGAIWNSKIFFLQEIMEKYENSTDMIFWIDIGLFDSGEYLLKNEQLLFPSSQRIEKIFLDGPTVADKPKLKEKMLFSIFPICIRNYPRSLRHVNLNKINNFIMAGFFGGPVVAAKQFIQEYWNYHDYFIKKNFHVLSEEKIMGAYCMLNKDKVFFINLRESQCNSQSSSIGFISHTNLCNFNNAVHTLIPTKSKTCTGATLLNSWL